MNIKYIEFKNFQSYGNQLQRIDFSDSSNFAVIVGDNGAGKSTISDIIKFAIYGRVANKRIPDLANRINKNAYTKIELIHNGNNIVIERGIKPNFVKLFINNVEHEITSKSDVDNYIENELLKFPSYIFNNTISLSVNKFKSFLTMSPADKKTIIDKITGLEIINIIYNIIKDKIKTNKTLLDKYNNDNIILSNNLSSAETELHNLREKILKSKENDIINIENDILKAKEEANNIKLELVTLNKILSDYKSKINKNNKYITKLKYEIKKINDIIHSNPKKCSVCSGDLTIKCNNCGAEYSSDFHIINIDDSNKKIKVLSKKIKFVMLTNKSLTINYNNKLSEFNNLNIHKVEIDADIKNNKKKLDDIKNSNNNETSSIENLINNIKDNIKNNNDNINKLTNQMKILKILSDIYDTNGVKQLAVANLISPFNNEVNKNIAELGLNYKIIFDTEFNAHISQIGFEVPISQLSTGEYKKIDLSVLVSLIKLMKIKFSDINLLFLDEIFTGLDNNSINYILNILKSMSIELGLNVFVINHTQLPFEIFDRKYEIKKIDGFSKIFIS